MRPTPTFPLPTDLPPKTALALFELLSALTDALWQHYEIELVELIREDLDDPAGTQLAFDFNDDPPF